MTPDQRRHAESALIHMLDALEDALAALHPPEPEDSPCGHTRFAKRLVHGVTYRTCLDCGMRLSPEIPKPDGDGDRS